jgi:serine/threonine protein kinase
VRDRVPGRDTPWSKHYLLQNSMVGDGRLEIAKRGVTSSEIDAELIRQVLHREVQMLTALRSRHVAPVYEFLEDIPEVIYGAKHFNKPSLKSCLEHFRGSPATIEQKFEIAFALHVFVSHCHGRDILIGHLDPQYLLIFPKNADRLQEDVAAGEQAAGHQMDDDNSSLLIMGVDLTCASRVDQQPIHRIRMGQYVSPECREGKAITPAADVYSLGVILTALFDDTCFSDRDPFTGIQNASIRNLPELKDLLLKMLATEQGSRPNIDEVRRELLIASIAFKERSEETGAWCPNCRAKVPRSNLGELVCGNCRGPLKRVTRQLMNDSSRGNTSVERLYIAHQLGAKHDVVFWARGGMSDGTLTGNARLIALEAATELPSELEFAQQLIYDFANEVLETDHY